MSIVNEILINVQIRAADFNARVIRQAFSKRRDICTSCKFPEHAHEWIWMHAQYVDLKQRYHRYQKYTEERYAYYFNRERAEEQQAFRIKASLNEQIKKVREEMRVFEPCISCRHLYNPTRRIKLVTPNFPQQGKDFFDAI